MRMETSSIRKSDHRRSQSGNGTRKALESPKSKLKWEKYKTKNTLPSGEDRKTMRQNMVLKSLIKETIGN